MTKTLRSTPISICARKIKGHPTVKKAKIKFENVVDLLNKIDLAIEDTDCGKVDVYVTNSGQFTKEELKKLDDEYGIIVESTKP